MPVVRMRLTAENAEVLASLRQVDAGLLRLDATLSRVQGNLDWTKGAASAAGLTVGLHMLYDELGAVIQRYNTLRGLDQGILFFHGRSQVEAMTKGLGDLAVQAAVTANVIRTESANVNLSYGEARMLGGFVRGQVLLGESPDPENAMRAFEQFVVGGRSQRLHMAGINVDTISGYRQYAAQLGIPYTQLSGDERLQARKEELFRNLAFQNSARFGEQAISSGFQSAGAFIQNTKDSYVRSIAAGMEELAAGIMHVAAAGNQLDSQKMVQNLGQIAAIATPGTIGIGAIGGAFLGFGQRRVQLSMLEAQLQTAQGPAAMNMVNTAGALEIAAMQRAAAQDMYTESGQMDITGRRFDQTVGGRQLVLAETQAAQKAMAAETQMAGITRQSQLAQGSIVGTTNALTAFIAVQAGLAVATTLWTAYSMAVHNAAQASKDFKEAAEAGVDAGIKLGQLRSGGTAPIGVAQSAQTYGLRPEYANMLQAWMMQNPSAGDQQFTQETARLFMLQQQEVDRPTELSATRWQSYFQFFNPTSDTFLNPQTWQGFVAPAGALKIQNANEAQEQAARIVGMYRNQIEAQKALEEGVAAADYQKLKDKLDLIGQNRNEYGGAEADLGVPREDRVAWKTFERQRVQAILGFDYSSLRGPEREEFLQTRGEAIREDIGLRMQDKAYEKRKAEEAQVAAIRKNIEGMEKENAARLQVAAIQDQALGANLRLVDVTNREQAIRSNAQAVLSQYQSLLAEGNTALIAEFEAHNNVAAAANLLAVAQLDLVKGMRDALSGLQSGVGAGLDSAQASIGARMGGQYAIEGALAGENRYLAAGSQLLGKERALGLTEANLSVRTKLEQAIRTGQMPAGLSPDEQRLIQQALGAYGGMNKLEQGNYRNTLASENYRLQDEVARGYGDVVAGNIDLQTMLQNVPYEQRKQLEQFLNSPTAAQLGGMLPGALRGAQQYDAMTPEQLAAIKGVFAPGFDINGAGPTLGEGQEARLSSIALQRSELAQSMYDLKGSIDANTAAMQAYLAGVPSGPRHDTSGWGDRPMIGPLPLGVDNLPVGPNAPVSELMIPTSGGVPQGAVKGMSRVNMAAILSDSSYRADVARRAHDLNPGASCATCASIPLADAGMLAGPIGRTDDLAAELERQGWLTVPPSEAREAEYALMFTQSRNRDPAPDHVYTLLGGRAWDKGKMYDKGRGGSTPDAYGMIPPTAQQQLPVPLPVTITNPGDIARGTGSGIIGTAAGVANQYGGGVLPAAGYGPGASFVMQGGGVAGSAGSIAAASMAWGGANFGSGGNAFGSADYGSYGPGVAGVAAGVTSDWSEYN